MLEKLINAHSISGDEGPVREMIKREIKKHVDELYIDKIGNLVAHKKGKKPSVMLTAHMDEVGLMIKRVSQRGHLYFSFVGGLDEISVIGQKVIIDQKIKGVITTKLLSQGNMLEEIPQTQDLYIDTGLTKKELEKKKIGVGSYASFDQGSFDYLGSKKVISGKALDDRIGCFVLLELAKRLKNSKSDIYYVFTVQEEIGSYGAKISAYKLNPDWAIVVDVTDADLKTKILGNGPSITVKDADMIGNRCINKWFKDIAKKNRINIQWDVSDFGTTDALRIALSKEGVPTSVIGVPVKNLHTSTSIAHMDDVNDMIKLLEKLLANPPKVCLV